MIITTQKPLDEILNFISPYSKVLIAGCDGCTQPPRSLKEAQNLSQLLQLGGKLREKDFKFESTTMPKQCDSYLVVTTLKSQVENADAVLSLACGVGVQTLAEVFPDVPVFPAQNTLFIGAEEREKGILEERCTACGDCILALTGGICPVTRCAKGLLNGPCGGAKNGKCEVDPEKDCAWELIYRRLKEMGKLDRMKEIQPPKDYSESRIWKVGS
jgi:hypothetical protein